MSLICQRRYVPYMSYPHAYTHVCACVSVYVCMRGDMTYKGHTWDNPIAGWGYPKNNPLHVITPDDKRLKA
jgi:hypothetical protein